MGDRYHFTVTCPKCSFVDDDAYYAPSCGFTKWQCHKCGYMAEIEYGLSLGSPLTKEDYEANEEVE